MIGLSILWMGNVSASYQLGFQDPATTSMEGIFLFNLHLLFVIIGIIIVVAWLLYSISINFLEFDKRQVTDFTHFNAIEIVWTSVLALILLSLASPVFSLLYSLDEISNPELTLKILGHQWYWMYEISDSNSCSEDNQTLKYSSYILTDEFLKENNSIGFFRNLETNKTTNIGLSLSVVDIIKAWMSINLNDLLIDLLLNGVALVILFFFIYLFNKGSFLARSLTELEKSSTNSAIFYKYTILFFLVVNSKILHFFSSSSNIFIIFSYVFDYLTLFWVLGSVLSWSIFLSILKNPLKIKTHIANFYINFLVNVFNQGTVSNEFVNVNIFLGIFLSHRIIYYFSISYPKLLIVLLIVPISTSLFNFCLCFMFYIVCYINPTTYGISLIYFLKKHADPAVLKLVNLKKTSPKDSNNIDG